MWRIDLSNVHGLNNELKWLKTTPYPKVHISNRSMTIKGMNYIYETGYTTKVRDDQEWRTFSSESIEQTNMQLHVT